MRPFSVEDLRGVIPPNVMAMIKAHREGETTGIGSTDAMDEHPPETASCSVCRGVGFVRRNVSPSDLDFGKALPCPCCPLGEQKRIARFFHDAQVPPQFQDLTFNSYPVTPASEVSLEVVRDWVTGPLRPSLFLYGPYGTGKTGLALCAMRARAERDQCGCLFLTTPTLLDRIRDTYGPGSNSSESEVMQAVKTARLLVLDDLGAERATDWVAEKLFTLINHRHDWRLPTIFTSNLRVQDLADTLTERTAWRIAEMAQTVHLDGPNLRRQVP